VKTSMNEKKKILIGKLGLDGHDRGAKMLCLALRDNGMEVIYAGLRQTPESLLMTAIEEDVDIIGLSFLSGAHMPKTKRVMKLIAEKGLEKDMKVIIGGTIPERDIKKLEKLGVAGVFPTGISLEHIISSIKLLLES